VAEMSKKPEHSLPFDISDAMDNNWYW